MNSKLKSLKAIGNSSIDMDFMWRFQPATCGWNRFFYNKDSELNKLFNFYKIKSMSFLSRQIPAG
ncbi:hypothetical protein JW960_29600, partial [candidate division KSB1 bacterium]|nr:hypothetical protein [candidate division KSB1 bacterium]